MRKPAITSIDWQRIRGLRERLRFVVELERTAEAEAPRFISTRAGRLFLESQGKARR